MIIRPTRFLVALILIVTVTAMGFAAASARGQMTIGGQAVVLCSGSGLVQIARDVDGKPTGGSHLCPDLATSLLAAHNLPPVEVTRPATLAAGIVALQPHFRALLRAAAPRVRDPPVSA